MAKSKAVQKQAKRSGIQATDQGHPLKGSLRLAISSYRTVIASMLVATIWPLVLIGVLRWLSDDYTGDQYAIVIGLISIFLTMLIARIAVVGWDRQHSKLAELYSAVMSRLLAGIGLFGLIMLHAIPLVFGVFLMGIGLTGEAARWVVVPGLISLLIGFFLMLSISFAVFSLMEDLSLTVWQSYRISLRLSRRYWRTLAWRAVVVMLLFTFIVLALAAIGYWAATYVQDPRIGLVLDAVLSWLITPFIFFYLAIVFRRLVQAYE